MASRVTTTIWAQLRRNVHTKSWKLPVSPGGTLKARLPTTCSLVIHPLDPHTSDWTQAHVDMHVLGETDDSFISEETAKQVCESFEASIISDVEPGRNFIQLESSPDTTPTSLARGIHKLRSWLGDPLRGEKPLFDSRIIFHVYIPGKFDLDIELLNGNVIINDTIEGDIRITTKDANVISKSKLKSMYVDIDVDDGDISLNGIQGNLSIRSGKGFVDISKIQGPCVRVISESGDVQVRALYADYAMFKSKEGIVRLGTAQGYTKIRTMEGDIEVAGVEGRLDIETDCGDVEANLSVPRTVTMRSRSGDIAVGLPDGITGCILLEGGVGIDIDDNVGFRKVNEDGQIVKGRVGHGKENEQNHEQFASVHARAPAGDVSVSRKCWAAATLYPSKEHDKQAFPRWVNVLKDDKFSIEGK